MQASRFFAASLDRATARRAAAKLPIALGRHQVFILPTRFGWLAAFATIAMFLVALNYQNSLVFLLAFVFGALNLVAMVACHRHLSGLAIRAASAQPVFAGEPIPLVLDVANQAPRKRWGIACYAGPVAGVAATIPPGAAVRLKLMLPARRRGRHMIGRTGLSSLEPFGVFRAWCRLAPVECIVYPRPATHVPRPTGAAGTATDGLRDDRVEDFIGLARYRPGDRPGQIAWPAYARSGALERKRFGGGRGGANRFDFADTPGANAEAKLSVLAGWALAAAREGARWELSLPGYALAPGRGPAHLARTLRALAFYPGPYDDG